MDTIFELIEKITDLILKLHHKFALNTGFKLWRANERCFLCSQAAPFGFGTIW